MVQLAFVLLVAFGVFGHKCVKPRERREIRDLSLEERTRFINAIRCLHSGQAPTQYDRLAKIHLDSASLVHGTPQFLTWHREYLVQFEGILQSVDPSVTLPYWDWTLDASDPAASSVLSQDFMGGNGGKDKCVNDGPFAGWQMAYPEPHCLKRSYDNGNSIYPLFSNNAILDLLATASSFEKFTLAIEALPHSRVHIGIGGKKGDMAFMFSSNDPIFWLHHAYIDRIYFEWQQRYPRLAKTHSGNPTQPLTPFNATSIDVYSTTSGGRYCYIYPRILSSSSDDTEQAVRSLNDISAIARKENAHIPPIPDYWIERNNMDASTAHSLEAEFGVGQALDNEEFEDR